MEVLEVADCVTEILDQDSWFFIPLAARLAIHVISQTTAGRRHVVALFTMISVFNVYCVYNVYNAQVAASMQRRLFGKPRRRISGSAGGSHHGQECGFNCTTSCFGLNGTIFHF